ncbi:uncharacterized protein LOC131433992 [Malaya genurostris]|uniref:uncharacterized protein LOC131433992 n=1 Tax=Malaya genurostris TaxID=325434 RepID=UPI0026F37DDD|nr:uncharacterized protein LOC131433992 [Malaya genurostris]
MANACDRCAKTVKSEEDFVECSGFCHHLVHMKCAKLNKPFLKVLDENPNLFWICDECCKLIKLARFRDSVSSFGSAFASIAERTESIFAELKAEIKKNSQQISRLSRKVPVSSPLPPKPDGFGPNAKRRREDSSEPSKTLEGCRKPSDNCNIATVPTPCSLVWIYLSRFHPSVSKEMVSQLTKDGLQCSEDVTVIPLVKKDVDVNTLNFVSFKVGILPKFREAALNPDTWPQGVLFREFEDNKKQNIWYPPIDISPPIPDENGCSTVMNVDEVTPSPLRLMRTPPRQTL